MRANQVLLSKSLEILVTMNDRSGSTYENVTSDLNGYNFPNFYFPNGSELLHPLFVLGCNFSS